MGGPRFVVLGLAQARSPWFRSVAQWSNSASIPVEFVKCMSSLELRAHLTSGRAFSALLVDGALPALDRDLFDEARGAGCAVLVVDDVRVTRDWLGLGANAVINPVFERKDLLDVLGDHAAEVRRSDALPMLDDQQSRAPRTAMVAMVCGPGGTGASTMAIALAQGLADDPRYAGGVLLADLSLRAEQAMLHDARDVVPGVQELVDAHRTGRPSVEEVRSFTFDIEERRYDLLLGLRRARNWAAIRPRAFAAAVDSLTVGWKVIVCDAEADLEGEDDGGSADVEDRNVMARTAASAADTVFAIGLPGMKGLHSLVRVLGELLDHRVPAERILPVINRAPKSIRLRAEMTSAMTQLLDGRSDAAGLPTPIFLPERRVDEALRDGIRLPAALSAVLAGAFAGVTGRVSAPRPAPEPERVQPGSLGHWSGLGAETA